MLDRKSTRPKPFVFVLIPSDKKFGDIYKFGIKGAANEVDAYAERLDEQIFTEGMLDRIFNQISKADVVVADMTGRNPNVFYELGLAHALQKPVVLVSSNENDVPFDLHHIRVIYYDVRDPFWGAKLIDKIAENILSAIKNPEDAIFKSEEDE